MAKRKTPAELAAVAAAYRYGIAVQRYERNCGRSYLGGDNAELYRADLDMATRLTAAAMPIMRERGQATVDGVRMRHRPRYLFATWLGGTEEREEWREESIKCTLTPAGERRVAELTEDSAALFAVRKGLRKLADSLGAE